MSPGTGAYDHLGRFPWGADAPIKGRYRSADAADAALQPARLAAARGEEPASYDLTTGVRKQYTLHSTYINP